jgi:hypothetical protein
VSYCSDLLLQANHILIGEEELSQSTAIRSVFWKHMHILSKIKEGNEDAYNRLIYFYDKTLGLIPTDTRGNGLQTAEADLLAEIIGIA